MRWRTGRRSSNIEDRRGGRMGAGLPDLLRRGAGGGGGRPLGKGGLVITLLILLGLYFLGVDPRLLLQSGGGPGAPGASQPGPAPSSSQQDQMADFVSVVLADTEDTWHALFRLAGQSYQEPELVLFTDLVRSACGTAQSAMGPFYCPLDRRIYIDLDFYRELQHRYGAPGDFAQAYVIAHEVGHHVQNLLGLSDRVQALRRRVSEEEGNRLSVRVELQADCLAGIWAHTAHRTRNILEAGDIEEALNAASSIGDDRLQHESRGRVVPETFTHGTSAQRMRWFSRGMESGELQSCNTFASDAL